VSGRVSRGPGTPWPDPPTVPPGGPRVELDRLTGQLPAGAAACARWGQALVDGWRDGDSGPLAESRRVAKRVANLLTGGGVR